MSLPADIFARYHRLAGNNVAMVSGSDMHGSPTSLMALDEGTSPEQIAYRYHAIWESALQKMNISYDLYTTTHTKNHADVTQDIFLRLHEKGLIYERTQHLPFSETEGIFLSDRLVVGVCPNCSYERARGDQCENCGKTFDVTELLNIRSTRDGSKPIFKDTKHQFLKLTAFKDDLEKWVADKSDWRPNVKNQTLAMIRTGLLDRAITRDLEWGIDVPLKGYENKSIYVWFEAVIGYLSATKEWAAKSGNPEAWREFWEMPAESYYFQGKDSVPFHAVIWPSILLGYGGLNLPTDVVANEFLKLGDKFSKSHGNAVWVQDYLSRYDPEPLRYYLSAIMPETSDSEFTWQGFWAANNNELVATYGNFVHRTLTLCYRNFDHSVPTPQPLTADDQKIVAACKSALAMAGKCIEQRHFRDGLHTAMRLAQQGNKYLDTQAPWTIIKTDKEQTATILWVSMYIITTLRVMFYPYLPVSSQKLHELLGMQGKVAQVEWCAVEPVPGTPIPNPTPLFNKLDDSIIAQENARLRAV